MWHRPTSHPRIVAVAVQHRCCKTPASSRARSNFRAGAVRSTPFVVKPNISVPVWQPSAAFMKYAPIRWLSHNLLTLATYQLSLEVGLTVLFGGLLHTGSITPKGVCDWLEAHHYPFVHWIDLDGGVYSEPLRVGTMTWSAETLTAMHTGHNIANGLLPLQALVVLTTLAPLQSAYRLLRGAAPADAAAAAAAAAKATTTPTPTATATAAAGTRRASYTRTGTTRLH
ncbi:hypothetical protein NESM_000067300 [Novymonas esmeraldas]|uniref:Uncharacterized protein n=1 Tax=Novymonas esmeraldas TaxID=1808958 RepID=A0AAW0F3G2_9TRYP